jgi:hypothetical protein
LREFMKKLLIIPILILLFGALYLYWKFNTPSEFTLKNEFTQQFPNTEVVETELIFDWEPKRILSYLVKYKEPNNEQLKDTEFAIRQDKYFQWHWCDDQTERKCD